MKDLTLIIGSKSLSSWSLRPWLFMKHHGVLFDEFLIELDRPATRAAILQHSPSGRVPVLKHGDITVWESLAICEYAAESFALPGAWPMQPRARAFARSIATEMHAGFADLRKELPFDAKRQPLAKQVSARAAADVARVRAIWREARKEYGNGGEWLFGRFSIADAMFAPVALRFHAYAVPLEGIEREYMFAVLMHPAVQDWIDAAAHERPAPEAPPRIPEGEATGSRTVERTVEQTAERIAEMVMVSTVATPPEQLRAAAATPPTVPVLKQGAARGAAPRAEPSPAAGTGSKAPMSPPALPDIEIDPDEVPPLPTSARSAASASRPPRPPKPAEPAPASTPPSTPPGVGEGDPNTEPVKERVTIRTVILPPD